MRQRRSFYLNEDELKYILDYKIENDKSSRNEALSCIINEHKAKSEIPMQSIYEYMSKQIATELKKELNDTILKSLIETLKPQLNSLKFATNDTNKDTKILLELINGIYHKEDYGAVPTIDTMPSLAYELAKKYIEGNIANKHRIKSNTLD
ncbi:Uncharacterised protein [uncultured Clostridium sp.]|nr:Uncharacterised protein [uncultured Clostridium sp.]SCJ44990.1 Uncharacterised protein [uncultured Clostridium sp.]